MFGNKNEINKLKRRLYRIENGNNDYVVDKKIPKEESRLSTDESIKLAEEYMQKAFDRVISNEYVGNNTFEYRVMINDGRPFSGVNVTIIALVNGKKYVVSEDISHLAKRKIIKRETLDGEIYDLDLDIEQLSVVKTKILISILLKSMIDFSEEYFNFLIDNIRREACFMPIKYK